MINIKVASLKRVKDRTDIDLTQLVDPHNSQVIDKLTDDLFTLFDVLCALLQPQLDEKQVTVDDFGEVLDEAAAEQAVVALLEGVIDFFHEGKRMLLGRAFAKVKTAAERVKQRGLDQAMNAIESPEFAQLIEQSLSTSGS